MGSIVLLLGLGGCAASHTSGYDRYYAGSGAYRAPGTAADPWGPYIHEAARRFAISEQWIRAVIHQESGGHEYLDGQPITSSAGAMGLMQLMPQTYADMQSRFDLGSDPYEPHDNIMAGTGYISILNGKYGAPAFLAAYNAGPQRLEDYLYRGRDLPNETVNYVASITPNLGTEVAMTGPLATYARAEQLQGSPAAGPGAAPVEVAEAGPPDCTMAAADDPACAAPAPAAPARSYARPVAVASLSRPTPIPCSPDDAYNPDVPCAVTQPSAPPSPAPAPEPVYRTVAYAPAPRPAMRLVSPPPAAAAPPHATYGAYAVQVGAFGSSGQARFATTIARQGDFTELAGAQSVVQPVTPLGRGTVYRARLAGLSRAAASGACATLQQQGMACIVEPPGH
jgi:D-alanyl-D-alanine carboxypeptidase